LSRYEWVQQKKEHNKDAAKKARERKKLWMDLLNELIATMEELSEEGRKLESDSDQLLATLKSHRECKKEDDIGQYLDGEEDSSRKEQS
jgi:mRNA-degrading endonuclease YafQ of YafQ-DinJ toxin-antitoxin module